MWSEFWQARLTVCAIVCRHSARRSMLDGHEANDLLLLRNLPPPYCRCAFDLLCLTHSSQSRSILIPPLRLSYPSLPTSPNHPAHTAPDISPGINTGCPRGKAGDLRAQPLCHNKHRKRGGSKGSSSSKSLTIVSP